MAKAKHQTSKKPQTRRRKPESLMKELITQLGEALKSYQQAFDTIQGAKAFATHDYDALLKQLQAAIAEVRKIEKRLKKEKIELDGGDEYFVALLEEMEAYERIIAGLGNKANRTGRYGWLKYRRNLKAHNAARQNRTERAKSFMTIEEPKDNRSEKRTNENDKKEIPVVQASLWVTQINREAYTELQKLLKKHNYNFITSKDAANKTVLWLDAVALKVFRNSKQMKWHSLLREHRVKLMAEAYGFKPAEVEKYFDNIDDLDREGLTATPTPNIMGSLWLTLGIPREKHMALFSSDWAGMEFVTECTVLAGAHAQAIKGLTENYELKPDEQFADQAP